MGFITHVHVRSALWKVKVQARQASNSKQACVCVCDIPPRLLAERERERISIFSLLADIWVREGMIQELCAIWNGRRVNREKAYDSSRQRLGIFPPFRDDTL